MDEKLRALHAFILHNYNLAAKNGGKAAELFERSLGTHFNDLRKEAAMMEPDGFKRAAFR